jgi:hypothetical protein
LLTLALMTFGGSAASLRALGGWPPAPIAVILALTLIVVGARHWKQWPLTLSIVEAVFGSLILLATPLVLRAGLPSELTTSVLGAFVSVSGSLFALASVRWLLPSSRRQ